MSKHISDKHLRQIFGEKTIETVKQFEADKVAAHWDSLINKLI